MSTVLGFQDFFFIWVIVIIGVSSYAGGTAAYARFRRSDTVRLRRLEDKLDLILRQLGLEYQAPATPGALSDAVKALADDPATKIQAIAMHREQTGAGLKESKEAVEDYIADQGTKKGA